MRAEPAENQGDARHQAPLRPVDDRGSSSRANAEASAGGRDDSAGRVITAASTTSGRSARNTTRQDDQRSMALAAAGPMRPGTTHADENTANTRGRSSGG